MTGAGDRRPGAAAEPAVATATATADFAPEPASAREARRFLRRFLGEHGRECLLDAAELLLSEAATNVVLHAHTPYTVRLRLLPDGSLRVDVRDGDPQLPVQRHYAPQASTGRGMDLIAALSSRCGVEPGEPTGKTVWFVVDDTAGEEQGDEDALLQAWHVDLEEAASSAGGPVPLVLPALPAGLWLAARTHHDAILRELALYALGHPDQAVSADDLALADRARAWVSTRVVAELERADGDPGGGERADAAPVTGDLPLLDLHLEVPPDAAVAFEALRTTLDTAERLAGARLLLVSPGRPQVVAVRDWVCEQALSQLRGGSPSPWPGSTAP